MQSRTRSGRRLVTMAVAGLTAGAGLGACSGGSNHSSPASPATTRSTSGGVGTIGAPGGFQQALVKVIQQVSPDVVEIATDKDLGSGVLFDNKGDVVTNNHVADGATAFSVRLSDGRTENGTLVGSYPPDDLAVIHIDPPTGVAPAVFGDSNKLQVGDVVVAIGNPLGLTSSVTEGIVSYNGRTVTEPNNVVLPSTIQTSAAINPGNSGGALVDLAGEVVGIPTLAALDQQTGGGAAPGIGFAIPSDTVKNIASQIVAHGKVVNSDRAALGIAAADAVRPDGQPAGVAVVAVKPNGPAAQAGIPAGAIITALEGKQTPSLAVLAGILAQLQPGKSVKVTYSVGGASKTVTVTLGQLA